MGRTVTEKGKVESPDLCDCLSCQLDYLTFSPCLQVVYLARVRESILKGRILHASRLSHISVYTAAATIVKSSEQLFYPLHSAPCSRKPPILHPFAMSDMRQKSSTASTSSGSVGPLTIVLISLVNCLLLRSARKSIDRRRNDIASLACWRQCVIFMMKIEAAFDDVLCSLPNAL